MVWGLGRLGTRVLDQVAARHPDRTFAAVTAEPGRATALGPNVVPATLGDLAGDRAPLLVCVADDEVAALRSCTRIEEARAAVAARNFRLLEAHLDAAIWRDRPVLVVTNPVELLCAAVAAAAGHQRVYGAGMQVDAQRCLDVLAVGWELELPAGLLPVTGMHAIEPIPVLSAVPGLAGKIRTEPWPLVTTRLLAAAASGRLAWVRQPERMAAVFARHDAIPPADAYARVSLAVAALMSAEFDGERPPVDRAIGHVAALVDAWFAGGRVAVSGPCAPAGDEPVFLGGVLDLPDGVFRLPGLAPAEADLVAGQLGRLRALTGTVRAAVSTP